jgi:hypothetical protein
MGDLRRARRPEHRRHGRPAVARATIDPLAIVFAGLSFIPFAVTHYINRAARRALEDFRPALGDLDPDYPRFERQLTTTSFAAGLVGAIIGVGIVAAGTLTAGGAWGITPDNSVATNVVGIFLLLVFNGSLATFLLHEIGHLRTITHVHRFATNIQLWNVRSHSAFARVTAMAAIAITVPYVTSALFSALSTENPVVAIVIVIVALGFATLLFVGPLVGMRRRLVRERERQLSETDRAFEIAAGTLRAKVDAGDMTGGAELQSVLSALGTERDRLKKVSTWPWTADTLRAFLTSLGLPVLLWFLTTALGRLLFG